MLPGDCQKKYLQVEAWETIGAFNRTHAETESVIQIVRDIEVIGYQAHVQLWKDGVVVGGAVMPCYFTENCCKGKEGDAKHKASMSAAQTFATSKAYRMNFSYIAILAGYQPLPAEEVTEDMVEPNKTEHWCKEHDAAYFMKGKMKSYAHPIGDTGEWCHEHSQKQTEVIDSTGTEVKTPSATAQGQGEAVETEVKVKRDPKTIKDSTGFFKAGKDDYKLSPQQMLKMVGVTSTSELGSLAEAFESIQKQMEK